MVSLRKIISQLPEIVLKILSLHVKLEIKCIQTSRKERFHLYLVVILLKNGSSIRHMFCKIFVPLFMTKALEKTRYKWFI